MSATQLSQVLGKSGVTVPHFKDFIRGQMSWSRTVTGKFRAETVSKSTSDAMFEIRKSGEDKPETYEYIMEQTIFVIPSGQSKAVLSQRRAEALAFKQGFTKCGETAAKAVGLRDVTVRSLPRSFEEQLPPEWKDELADTAEGETTGIKNTSKGVEFIAVCSKKLVSDDSAATVVSQQKDFDSFNESGNEQAQAYYDELKAAAKIIYR
jgi:peptidyl-prolyl cis-trans isomerase SurA